VRHPRRYVRPPLRNCGGETLAWASDGSLKDPRWRRKPFVRRRGEDRKDVTALLLYTKGEQLLDADQYELLRDEMTKLGIEVGLKGATCTLSKTSEELTVCMASPLLTCALSSLHHAALRYSPS
jgi:hypothetical protein